MGLYLNWFKKYDTKCNAGQKEQVLYCRSQFSTVLITLWSQLGELSLTSRYVFRFFSFHSLKVRSNFSWFQIYLNIVFFKFIYGKKKWWNFLFITSLKNTHSEVLKLQLGNIANCNGQNSAEWLSLNILSLEKEQTEFCSRDGFGNMPHFNFAFQILHII